MQTTVLGAHVLVVEHRQDVVAIAKSMLTRLGCTFVAVTSAEAALAVLEDSTFSVDIVFADIQLPGPLSGYELAKLITARWPVIRTILTSGAADNQVIRGAARYEGYQVVPKPYLKGDLLKAIGFALSAQAPG